MATFLCSVAALAALVQAPSPAPPSPSDSLAALRERVARDSTDGAGWLLVGRGYLQLAEDAHGRAHRAEADSAWARAALDTAEGALARAAELAGPVGASAAGDSARVLRVAVWAARSRLTWEESGIAAALDAWGPLPTGGPHVEWRTGGLVWVTGPKGKGPAVPARDFVFAALRVGLDAHDPWADPALATYARAARVTRALCEPLATFKVAAEVPMCRR